jgi:SOS response regulatory protein OraA/RecX
MTNTSFEGHIIAAFKKEADAERYYQTLISHGYAQDEISIFMSEATKKKFEESDLNTTPSAAAAV